MWACANGHRDVVALLAQWDPSAMNISDKSGRNVAVVARQRGHTILAEELETRTILTVRGRSTTPLASPVTSVTSRQMLMAKRSSVDSISSASQANNNDANYCWRRPPVVKGQKLSRLSSFKYSQVNSFNPQSIFRSFRSFRSLL